MMNIRKFGKPRARFMSDDGKVVIVDCILLYSPLV